MATPDLIARMRRLLDERAGHDYVSVTHAHLTELRDLGRQFRPGAQGDPSAAAGIAGRAGAPGHS